MSSAAPKPRTDTRERVKVKLLKPIKVNGESVDELIMISDLTLGDLEAADRGKGEVNKMNHLISKAAKLPIEVIQKIHIKDFDNEEVEKGEDGQIIAYGLGRYRKDFLPE